jgi:hypothetical protein
MTPQTRELIDRIKLAQRHPIIGPVALSPGTTLTRTPGLARRAAAHAHSSRPDLAREIQRRLEPVKRRCEHCGFMVQKDADRCERCGKFVSSPEKVLKAEFQALVQQPDPGVAGQRLGPGSIVSHTPTGFIGRVLTITLDQRAILRNPAGQTISVPYSELEALGTLGAQPVPGGRQGGFEGTAAVESDIVSGHPYQLTGTGKAVPHGAMSKRTCTNCGAALSDEDIRDGQCPQCGADLEDSSAQWGGTGAGAWARTPHDSGLAAAYASPAGMLKLWRRTRSLSQAGGVFGRATTSATLRKGGLGFVRGQAVRNQRSGRRGVVLGSNGLTCAVEYTQGQVTSTVVEKASELERV